MDMHATGGRRRTGNIGENQSIVQTGGCRKKSRFHGRDPPTRDRLRRNPVKRQGSPDREKARPAPHSSMRASSRGTRDDDDAISGRGSPAPPLFVETTEADFQAPTIWSTRLLKPPNEGASLSVRAKK